MEHTYITIGPEGTEPVKYAIVTTTAPEAYDGFGTFTLVSYPDGESTVRIVLIREEHFTWQTSRYSSGMKGWTAWEGDSANITDALWKRLLKPEDTENL